MAKLDVNRLHVTVAGFEPIDDGKTFTYCVNVAYGNVKWEMRKRYSDFDSLQTYLAISGYCGLPPLPPKTILGRANDIDSIMARRNGLRDYLQALLKRPDTRTSPDLMEFLLFIQKTSVDVEPIRPFIQCSTSQHRFSLSSICHIPSLRAIILGHEERSRVSRLGRLWSLVEPDKMGRLSSWFHTDPTPTHLTHMSTDDLTFKVKAFVYDDVSGHLFVGLGNGQINIYELNTETFSLLLVKVLNGHTESIVSMTVAGNQILSVGFDSAIRIINMKKRDIVSGGRLNKRLADDEFLTTGCLEGQSARCLVGTSNGRILVFDSSKTPPSFLHSFRVPQTSAYPSIVHVNAIQFSKGHIFVGHGEIVTVFSLPVKGQEKRIEILAQFNPCLEFPNKVRSVECDRPNHRLYGGYKNTIVMWDLATGRVMCSWQAHEGNVNKIMAVEGGQLFTAGEDGVLKVWNTPPSCDLTLWAPQEESTSGSAGDGDVAKRKGVGVKGAGGGDAAGGLHDDDRPYSPVSLTFSSSLSLPSASSSTLSSSSASSGPSLSSKTSLGFTKQEEDEAWGTSAPLPISHDLDQAVNDNYPDEGGGIPFYQNQRVFHLPPAGDDYEEEQQRRMRNKALYANHGSYSSDNGHANGDTNNRSNYHQQHAHDQSRPSADRLSAQHSSYDGDPFMTDHDAGQNRDDNYYYNKDPVPSHGIRASGIVDDGAVINDNSGPPLLTLFPGASHKQGLMVGHYPRNNHCDDTSYEFPHQSQSEKERIADGLATVTPSAGSPSVLPSGESSQSSKKATTSTFPKLLGRDDDSDDDGDDDLRGAFL